MGLIYIRWFSFIYDGSHLYMMVLICIYDGSHLYMMVLVCIYDGSHLYMMGLICELQLPFVCDGSHLQSIISFSIVIILV